MSSWSAGVWTKNLAHVRAVTWLNYIPS
jgi:hypothetical protein